MVQFASSSSRLDLHDLVAGIRWFHEPGAWVERPRHAPSAPAPAAPGRITVSRDDRR